MYLAVLINLVLVSLLIAAQPVEVGGPGSLSIYASEHSVATEVRGLIAKGQLALAETRLREIDPTGDDEQGRLVVDGLEVIRRIRREFSLDHAALLAGVQESIPDVTAADIDRWADAGQVQYRTIDGERRFFRREPSNIWRFCDEARQRRDKAAGRSSDEPGTLSLTRQQLNSHIEQVITAAETGNQDEVLPIRHRIKYRITVPTGGADVKASSVVRCWMPFPQRYRQQQGARLLASTPQRHMLSPDGAGHRSLYLEQAVKKPGKAIVFEAEFEYVSSAYYPAIDDAKVRPLPSTFPRAYLAERPPHIVFTPELLALVKEVIGDDTNPLAKARRIFGWIDENIRYCSEMEYGIIPSFSGKVLEARRGDCGIQSILFITMCRAAGVPARWQSGWVTQPDGWNMHDWAEAYVEPWGWLPMDASHGLTKSDDPRVRWFYFGHLDAYRLIVNMDYGCDFTPPKLAHRSEPADFQRGEVEIDGRNLYFDEWEWDFDVTVEPGEPPRAGQQN